MILRSRVQFAVWLAATLLCVRHATAEEPAPHPAFRMLGETALLNDEPVVSMSSNGKDSGVVVFGETGSLARWELPECRKAWRRAGGNQHLTPSDISWSADASRVAVRFFMGTIEVKDVASGKNVCEIKDDGIAFSLSPGGDRLLLVRYEDSVALFDAGTGGKLGELGSDVEGVSKYNAMVLIDDHRAISSSPRGTMRLLDLSSPEKSKVLGEEGGSCWGFRLSRDGKQVAWFTESRQVRVAALDAAEIRGRDVFVAPHTIVDLDFSADGRELAILQLDGTLSVGKPESSDSFISVRTERVKSVRFANKDTLVLSGSGFRLHVVQRKDGKLVEDERGTGGAIVDLTWNPGGLTTLVDDSTLCRWDTESSRLIERVDVPSGEEFFAELSPGGDLWVVLDRKERDAPCRHQLFGKDGRHATIPVRWPSLGVISPDGRYAVSVQPETELTLTSLDRESPPERWNPQEVASLRQTDAWFAGWAFGSLFVAAHCESRKVQLLSVPSLKVISEFDTGLAPVSHFMSSYAPGGLVALSIADNLYFFEIWSGKQVAGFHPASDSECYRFVTFLPDGFRVAFVRDDHSIALLEIATHALHILAKAEDLPGPPRGLIISPDGRTLATVVPDGRIVLIPLPELTKPVEKIPNDRARIAEIAGLLQKDSPVEARAPLPLLASASMEVLQGVADELAGPLAPDEPDIAALGQDLSSTEPGKRATAHEKLREIATSDVVAVRKLRDSLKDLEARTQLQEVLSEAEAILPKEARQIGTLRFCEALLGRTAEERTQLTDKLEAVHHGALVDRVLEHLRRER